MFVKGFLRREKLTHASNGGDMLALAVEDQILGFELKQIHPRQGSCGEDDASLTEKSIFLLHQALFAIETSANKSPFSPSIFTLFISNHRLTCTLNRNAWSWRQRIGHCNFHTASSIMGISFYFGIAPQIHKIAIETLDDDISFQALPMTSTGNSDGDFW